MSAPNSTSSSALASSLVIGAAAFVGGAALGGWFASQCGRRSQVSREDPPLTEDAFLPPSTVDRQALSKIELGSDEMRRQFFLTDRLAASVESSSNELREAAKLPLVYLNHGSYGSVPRPVMNYFSQLLRRVERYPDIWFRVHSWLIYRKAMEPFAELMKCDPENLVFVNNATTAVNAVLHSLTLQKGDVILTADSTYNACKLAMKHEAARQGAEYVEIAIPLPLKREQDVVDLHRAALDELQRAGKTVKFVLVDAITSPTAIVYPYEAVSRLCRERGIKCMVDAAHAIGCIPLDFTKFDFDYFTTNLHKWLFGVKGSALLYARKEEQAKLHPTVTSHSTNESYTRRFWMQATRDDTPYVASVEGLRFKQAIGEERITKYTKQLLEDGAKLIVKSLESQYLASSDFSASSSSSSNSVTSVPLSSVSICPPSMETPHMRLIKLPWTTSSSLTEAQRGGMGERLMLHFMNHYRVVIPIIYENHSRSFWIRLSANVYNRIDDYQRLAEALEDYPKQPITGHLFY